MYKEPQWFESLDGSYDYIFLIMTIIGNRGINHTPSYKEVHEFSLNAKPNQTQAAEADNHYACIVWIKGFIAQSIL